MEPMEVDDPGGAEATTNALKALLAVLAAQRDPRVLRGAVARLGPADAVVALEAAREALDRGQRDAGLRLLACARGRLDRSSPAVAAKMIVVVDSVVRASSGTGSLVATFRSRSQLRQRHARASARPVSLA